MKKSFLIKLKSFLYYTKIIRNIENELFTKFGVKVDDAYRLYTILKIEENLMSPYLEDAIQKELTSLTKNLSSYLNSKGLLEMYAYYQDLFKQIDLHNYVIVYGFSLFRSDIVMSKFFNYLKISGLFIAIMTILYYFLQYLNN